MPRQLIVEDTPRSVVIMTAVFILAFVEPEFLVKMGGGLEPAILALFVRRCAPFRYGRALHRIHGLERTCLDTSLGKEGRRMTRSVLVTSPGMGAGECPIVEACGHERAMDANKAWLQAACSQTCPPRPMHQLLAGSAGIAKPRGA